MSKSIQGFPKSYSVGQSQKISNIEIAPMLKSGVECIYHFAVKIKNKWQHIDVRNIGLNCPNFEKHTNRLQMAVELFKNHQTYLVDSL